MVNCRNRFSLFFVPGDSANGQSEGTGKKEEMQWKRYGEKCIHSCSYSGRGNKYGSVCALKAFFRREKVFCSGGGSFFRHLHSGGGVQYGTLHSYACMCAWLQNMATICASHFTSIHPGQIFAPQANNYHRRMIDIFGYLPMIYSRTIGEDNQRP